MLETKKDSGKSPVENLVGVFQSLTPGDELTQADVNFSYLGSKVGYIRECFESAVTELKNTDEIGGLNFSDIQKKAVELEAEEKQIVCRHNILDSKSLLLRDTWAVDVAS